MERLKQLGSLHADGILTDDPLAAVDQAIGLVEATAERHGIPHPFHSPQASRSSSGRVRR